MTTTYLDELIIRVEKALKSLPEFPVSVKKWVVEVGDDATGENAIWVWAVVDDADLSSNNRSNLRNAIRDAVGQVVGDQPAWVYVRFRATSEV